MVTDNQKGQNNNNIETLSLLELLFTAKNGNKYYVDGLVGENIGCSSFSANQLMWLFG
jgi:hypothetical protein